ncbi:MAG: hypothetical protein HYS32_03460 [Candidatus Woesearchaeota archaeon]|nr:MAG: hypothetical protein HYS32_03460 [Candidatus Woesearchaeota archaeon]
MKHSDYIKSPIHQTNGIGEYTSEDKCKDSVKCFIKVKYNKIKDIGFVLEGCKDIKKTEEKIKEFVLNKKLEEVIDLKPVKDHNSETFIKALKNAIDDYLKNKDQDPLQFIIDKIQEYDEGNPPRTPETLKYDYELCGHPH